MQRKPQPHMIALCWFREEGSLPVIFYRNPVVLSREEVREALYAMRYLGPLTPHQISRVEVKKVEILNELTKAGQALFEALDAILKGPGYARETLERLLLLPEEHVERTDFENALAKRGLQRLVLAFAAERQKMLSRFSELPAT